MLGEAVRAAPATCVLVHTSAPSAFTRTVVFMGSMVACARYGASYVASTTRVLSATTSRAPP